MPVRKHLSQRVYQNTVLEYIRHCVRHNLPYRHCRLNRGESKGGMRGRVEPEAEKKIKGVERKDMCWMDGKKNG